MTAENLQSLTDTSINYLIFENGNENLNKEMEILKRLVTEELLLQSSPSLWYNHVKLCLLSVYGNQGLVKIDKSELTNVTSLYFDRKDKKVQLVVTSNWRIYSDPNVLTLLHIENNESVYADIKVDHVISSSLEKSFFTFKTLFRVTTLHFKARNSHQSSLKTANIEAAIDILSLNYL